MTGKSERTVSNFFRYVTSIILCWGVVGCATYAPLKIDPTLDAYNTSTQLEKSALREYETNVDPRQFRFVALNASSNVYPGRFEFFVRTVLADLGMTNVLNQDELVALIKTHPKLRELSSISDPLAVKKISDTVGPILIVDFSSTWDGDVRRYVSLKLTDASTGRILLRIEHPKLIWSNVDSEAHYPVFNALRQWYRDCATKKNSV